MFSRRTITSPVGSDHASPTHLRVVGPARGRHRRRRRPGPGRAAPTPPRLRSASARRAASPSSPAAGITNTGATTVNGDVGTFPTTSESGTASMTITGTNHAGDAVTQGAKNDLVTGYNTAAGESPPTAVPADLGGQTLNPGTYNSASSLGLTGSVTLNGGGNPNALFVFQAGSTLTTASASSVNLINGAQACNVFWQVGQLGDARHRLHLPRDHPGADVDHRHDGHDHQRPCPGPQRCGHPGHRHHHEADMRHLRRAPR